ncbi:unnamed protein product [Musa textilis]
MKRCGYGEEGDQTESVNVANVLMLLSRGSGDGEEIIDISSRASPVRVFACKTCNRQFPSFQALGGHRASHKKPRLAADGQGQGQGQGHAELAKPRVHECSVCGLEFAIGQALGGHMRRHRAAAPQGLTGKKPEDKRTLWLDLNMPPSEGDGGHRKKTFGFELADTTPPMVLDCFH